MRIGKNNHPWSHRFPTYILPMLTRLHEFLLFGSDAVWLAITGACLLALAGLAMFMDRRRLRRGRIDDVGWMPWTGLFLFAAVCGGGMLALAAPALLAAN